MKKREIHFGYKLLYDNKMRKKARNARSQKEEGSKKSWKLTLHNERREVENKMKC